MEDMGKELSKRLVENKWEKKYKEIIEKSLKDDDVQLFLRENKDRLSHQEILKGASKLYEFVDLKQKIAEGKEVFAPGYSPQLTISDHHIEVTYVPTKKLIEERRLREINNRINIVNLPKSIRKATLENYYRDDDGRMIALKKAIEFVANYTETPNIFHKGLYLSGSFGVGKTYLAAFDSKNYQKVLFVAHREEILKQAAVSFKNVRNSDDYGFFYGGEKTWDKSVIFASVATLGRPE